MKLMIALVPEEGLVLLLDVLQQAGIPATVIHLEHAVFHAGWALLLIAVVAVQVPRARGLIASAVQRCLEPTFTDAPPIAPGLLYLLPVIHAGAEATIAVLPLVRYERL